MEHSKSLQSKITTYYSGAQNYCAESGAKKQILVHSRSNFLYYMNLITAKEYQEDVNKKKICIGYILTKK